MDIRKEACVAGEAAAGSQVLALVNAQSPKKLTAEEIFTFSVRLCDNELDRDNERFTDEALDELAEKFIGKSGIFDHEWSAKGQTARIFAASVVQDESMKTAAGGAYRYLRGEAYMLRTQANRDLIAEVAGGIKKEVSVGCAVARATCNICGTDRSSGKPCAHVKGKVYEGKRCWTELSGVTDAYEWSFVAVPAQPKAGVIKKFEEVKRMDLRKAAEGNPACIAELEALEAQALLGRQYLEALRKEVARLGGLAQTGLDRQTMEAITKRLEEPELRKLKASYEQQAQERYPAGGVQLTYHGEKAAGEDRDGAFLI